MRFSKKLINIFIVSLLFIVLASTLFISTRKENTFLVNLSKRVIWKIKASFVKIVMKPGKFEWEENGFNLPSKEFFTGVANSVKGLFLPKIKCIGTGWEIDEKFEGAFKCFYDNGQLAKKGEYKNDELAGDIKAYYPGGELLLNLDTDKNFLQVYYENGTLVAKCDPLKGNCKIYNELNDLSMELSFKPKKVSLGSDLLNLELEGISKLYYENGNLKGEVNYKNNKQEGKSIEYFLSGPVKEDAYYKNNKLHALRKVYVLDNYDPAKSRIRFEQQWKDGLLHGLSKEYNSSSEIIRTINYKNNKRDGISISYWDFSEGLIEYKDLYKNGELVWRKAYDEEGKLKFEQKY